MSKITYDDKIDLHVDSSIANINKVSASDMNEIKTAVNNNDDSLGDISTLTTTDKTSVVNAINELEADKLETSAIVNEPSTETDEVYSSDYLNDKLVSVGTTAPTDGRRVWFKKSRNLLKFNLITTATTYSGVTFTPNNDGTITLNGTATSSRWVDLSDMGISSNSFNLGEVTNTTKSLTNNNYTLSAKLTNGKVNVSFNSTNKMTSCYLYADTTYNNAILQIQFEKGSTATTYEPYVEPSINVDEEEWYSKSKVLWTNPSITTDFAGQTISLLDNLANYSHYEILYYLSKDNTETFTTGKIPIDKDTRISVPRHLIGYRSIQPRGTSMYLSNHSQFTTYGQTTSTNTNGICIPYQVLGYKE